MMLRYSLNLSEEAQAIEKAVASVLDKGYRTGDIASAGTNVVGTKDMGRIIREEL